MSLQTTLSGRIQMGHKSGLFIIYYLGVNIKPPRHRFGLSLCLGLAIRLSQKYNVALVTKTKCFICHLFKNLFPEGFFIMYTCSLVIQPLDLSLCRTLLIILYPNVMLSKPKFNQQLNWTEFEVRLHSYWEVHPTTHPPPQTICCGYC